MDDDAPFTMLDLDRALTRVLQAARRSPVPVHRYGKPWVWIVSHDAWLEATRWAVPIPAAHPLTALREHIDPLLARYEDPLRHLARELELAKPPASLVRAIVLGLTYGIAGERLLVEQLRHNVLFEWFVGLAPAEGETARLAEEVARLAQAPATGTLIDLLLEHAPLARFGSELGLPVYAAGAERIAPAHAPGMLTLRGPRNGWRRNIVPDGDASALEPAGQPPRRPWRKGAPRT